jgi:hypothetical protein
VKNLVAKITLILLLLTTLATLPTELRADGNPIPTCGGKPCEPKG